MPGARGGIAQDDRRARRRIFFRCVMRLDEVRVESARTAQEARRERDDLLERVDAEREVRPGEQRSATLGNPLRKCRQLAVPPRGADDDWCLRRDRCPHVRRGRVRRGELDGRVRAVQR